MSSKNKKKAQQTQQTVNSCSAPVNSNPQPCETKHWFGIRVKDDRGHEVTNVKVRILLNNGSTIEPGLGVNGEYRTGLILDNANPCTVSFPDLFDCEWWPSGSTAPKPTEAGQAMTAGDGDCVVSMAAKNNYRDYHEIWDASENDGLKATRPNPDCLMPGDTVNGPALKTKTIDKPADAFCDFVVRSIRKPKVKIVLVDKDLKPLDGWAWQLLTPSAASGTTGGDGLIEFDHIDPVATSGTLKVTVKTTPAPPAPTTTAPPLPSPPPYPPPINPPQFIDKPPAAVAGQDAVEWTVKIGSLPPAKEKNGVKARLHDFGYNCDVDSDDTTAGAAISSFQKNVLKKPVTGAYADVQDDLDSKFSA